MNYPPFEISDLDDRMHFSSLHKKGILGEGITIAVLDSGINHIPDIEGTVILNKDFTGEDDPSDFEKMHGTTIAQLIHLIAPRAKIANLKVIPHNKQPDREIVIKAVQFCMDQYPGYKIINLSIYFTPGCGGKYKGENTCELCASVNTATDKGILAIAAAGNEGPHKGTITCPGSCEKAMTVGSSWTKEDAEWWEKLNIIEKWIDKSIGSFGKVFGTSYSAAYISGGAALLLSFFNEASPYEIKQAIMKSAYKIKSPSESPGGADIQEAFLFLKKYLTAKEVLYFNMGNELAQKNESEYIINNLEFSISYIMELLIKDGQWAKAIKELNEIHSYLYPNALPTFENKINQLLSECYQKLNTQTLV